MWLLRAGYPTDLRILIARNSGLACLAGIILINGREVCFTSLADPPGPPGSLLRWWWPAWP